MSKNYNTRTASLKATIADIRNLDAKQIDAKKINLNGQNIEDLWGFQTPRDFKKLCTRCELPEDKPWALWTDAGNLVYFNQSDRIVNGTRMFQNYSNLTTFPSDLSSLTNGGSMFYGCSNLTSFSSDLSSLADGSFMFKGCKLNKESVINIINCLKNSNTCSEAASLTLGIDASLKTDTELQTLLGITEGATSATLVGHGGGTWTITIEWN